MTVRILTDTVPLGDGFRRDLDLAAIMFGATRSADHFWKNDPHWMECPLCLGGQEHSQPDGGAVLHLVSVKGFSGKKYTKWTTVAVLEFCCESDHQFELHFHEGKGAFYASVENATTKERKNQDDPQGELKLPKSAWDTMLGLDSPAPF